MSENNLTSPSKPIHKNSKHTNNQTNYTNTKIFYLLRQGEGETHHDLFRRHVTHNVTTAFMPGHCLQHTFALTVSLTFPHTVTSTSRIAKSTSTSSTSAIANGLGRALQDACRAVDNILDRVCHVGGEGVDMDTR